MKNTKFTLSAVAPDAGCDNETTVMNMRPNPLKGCLEPVGSYSAVTTVTGKPLTAMDWNGKTFILSWSNGQIYASDGLTTTQIKASSVCPTVAVAFGDTVVFMVPGREPLRLRPRAIMGLTVWDDVSVSAVLPRVRFECVQRRQLSATTGDFTLEGEYAHWTGPMTDNDRKTITRRITDAYTRLEADAQAAGLSVQPTLMWWRLIDESGRCVYSSVPVLMSASGVQPSGSTDIRVGLQGTWFKNAKSSAVYADAFLPGVCIDRASTQPWTVEVMMTPPLDTVCHDCSVEAAYRFNGATATEASLLVEMARVMNPLQMVELALDRLEAVSEVVMRLPASSTTDGAMIVGRSDTMSARSRQKKLLAALSRPLAATEADVWQCVAPNSFTAGTGALVGDMALWGNVTPVRCRPAQIDALSTMTSSASAWAGGVSAELTSGEKMCDTTSGQTNAPVQLSALIAYPAGLCKALTLQLSDSSIGGRRSNRFTLHATASGRWAVYLAKDLAPIDPAQWDAGETALQPGDTGSPTTQPSTVMAAPGGNPLGVECSISLGDGCVKAITGAARTQSAWDFARRHLYAFTSQGIYSLAVNSARTLCSAHLIYPCGVGSAAQVAAAGNGVYAVTTAGQLIRVSGSTAREIMRYGNYSALGWSAEHGGELWCAQADGGVRLLCAGNKVVEITDQNVSTMLSTRDGRLWLVGTAGGLTPVSSADQSGFTTVGWRRQIELPTERASALRLIHIDCDFTSPMATGRLVVSGHNGNAARARVLGGFRISGAVNAPMRLAVAAAAPYRFIVAEFVGSVTAQTRLGNVSLTFTKSNADHR